MRISGSVFVLKMALAFLLAVEQRSSVIAFQTSASRWAKSSRHVNHALAVTASPLSSMSFATNKKKKPILDPLVVCGPRWDSFECVSFTFQWCQRFSAPFLFCFSTWFLKFLFEILDSLSPLEKVASAKVPLFPGSWRSLEEMITLGSQPLTRQESQEMEKLMGCTTILFLMRTWKN